MSQVKHVTTILVGRITRARADLRTIRHTLIITAPETTDGGDIPTCTADRAADLDRWAGSKGTSAGIRCYRMPIAFHSTIEVRCRVAAAPRFVVWCARSSHDPRRSRSTEVRDLSERTG